MKITDLFREKTDKARSSAASALEVTSAAKDKASAARERAAAAKDKAAEARVRAAEIKDRFAPAIKELTDEAGSLAKEAESELKYLADRKKIGGGFGALIKKPAEDDILTMSRKARRKANKLERKAAKLERKLRKIEKKQIKALKKIENQ